MNRFFTAVLAVLAIVSASQESSHAAAARPQVQTVAKVDLQRYMGLWYEISRLDHRFQRNCIGSHAEYSLRQDGEVVITNRCTDERDGSMREAKGHAWSVDPESNARLKVSFFWPFRGDYWIIDLGEKYDYSVVGSPDCKYLWILSRKPEMDNAIYDGISEKLRQMGCPVDNLIKKPLVIKSAGIKTGRDRSP